MIVGMKARETRYARLGYGEVERGLWRFVDLEDGPDSIRQWERKELYEVVERALRHVGTLSAREERLAWALRQIAEDPRNIDVWTRAQARKALTERGTP